jgi:fengycin family lipopeptide synthetase D
MVERSLEMLIGIMGILKAGGAYLPIDPSYPEERIKFILTDSAAHIVLTTSELSSKIKNAIQIIDIHDDILRSIDKENLVNCNQPTDLAYVIYTSGTTGQPKGVMIEHHGIANLQTFFREKIGVTQTDRIIQFASCSFDASVWEIFMSLLNGVALYLVSQKTMIDYVAFENFLNLNEITVATLPPPYLNNLRPGNIHTLKKLITAGSVSTWELMNKWQDWVEFFNAYGPTETTICATIWQKEKYNLTTVPIGKPISNTRIYILDANDKLVPTGVFGELCVAGVGVARGYLNRPELTQAKFIDFDNTLGAKVYKTGDLARWLPDGNIEFLGRKDQQVKIRGYRIELGEIEHRLIRHELIKEAVVIERVDNYGDNYLCAYLNSEKQLNGAELATLKLYLSEFLPEYMIPSQYIQIDQIPLTISGKIDRDVLLKFEGIIDTGGEYIPPEGNTEVKLVEIWKEVLGIEKVGVKDQFFAIGGNSLKLIQVHMQIENLFPGKVTLADLFSYVNIESLAQFINREELMAASIQIEPVVFPAEYFMDEDEENEDTILEFTIPQEQLTRMKNMALKDEVEVHDILIATYLWTLGEVVTGEEITVQIMVDAYRIFPLKINITDITELSNLIQIVHQKLGMVTIETTYFIESIRKIGFDREYDMVVPFFAKKENLRRELSKIGDLIFCVDEVLGLNFYCEYNTFRLRKRKMEKLISRYAELVLTISD